MAVYSCCVANVAQRQFDCLLSFILPQAHSGGLWNTCVSLSLTCSQRNNSVVCFCSAIPLRPSCIERHTQTILLSAVVLAYSSGHRAANVVQRQFCALPSFWRTVVVATTVFFRNMVVVLLVAFWHCLAASIFAAYSGYFFSQFLTFHTLLINFRGA